MKHYSLSITEDQYRSLLEACDGVLKDLWDLGIDNTREDIAYWQRLKAKLLRAKISNIS